MSRELIAVAVEYFCWSRIVKWSVRASCVCFSINQFTDDGHSTKHRSHGFDQM